MIACGLQSEALQLQLTFKKLCIPTVISVRHRYWKDKIERGPLHRMGYKDRILSKGLLPHCADFDDKKLPHKPHRPANPWAPKFALFGQNDYIDILGDGRLRPTDVCYKVPPWLRGFKGNEYQMLLRRNRVMGETMKEFNPTKYSDMMLRMKYLYTYLNTKTKDYYWKDT